MPGRFLLTYIINAPLLAPPLNTKQKLVTSKSVTKGLNHVTHSESLKRK